MRTGKIRQPGRTIICLPNRVSVEISAGTGADPGRTGAGFAAAGEQPEESAEFYAMDTVITVRCAGEWCGEAIEAASEEIARLDALLSAENPQSEVSLLNREKKAEVQPELAAILLEAVRISEVTEGCFDVTVRPLMKLWGFREQPPSGGTWRYYGSPGLQAACLSAFRDP